MFFLLPFFGQQPSSVLCLFKKINNCTCLNNPTLLKLNHIILDKKLLRRRTVLFHFYMFLRIFKWPSTLRSGWKLSSIIFLTKNFEPSGYCVAAAALLPLLLSFANCRYPSIFRDCCPTQLPSHLIRQPKTHIYSWFLCFNRVSQKKLCFRNF